MKKIKFLAVAFTAVALLFTGCENVAGLLGGDSGSVKSVKVSEVTTINGQKVQQANKVENKEQFDQVVLAGLMGSASSLIPSRSETGTPDFDDFRAAVKSVTIDALGDSFDDLEAQFDKAGEGDTVKIDWKGPTGKLDFAGTEFDELKNNVEAVIDDLYIKVDATHSESGTTETVKGSSSAKAAGSITVSSLPSSPIPNAKVNAAASLKASKISATAVETNDDTEITSASGTIAFSSGFDSAFLFDVEDDSGKRYNGVIKATASVKVNQKLSKEKIEEFAAITEELGKRKSTDYSKLDKYATVKISIDVYDVNGHKLFTYFSADSISSLMSQVNSMAASI